MGRGYGSIRLAICTQSFVYLLVNTSKVSVTPNPADVLADSEQLYRVADMNPDTTVECSPTVTVMGSLSLPTSEQNTLYPEMTPFLSSSRGGAQEKLTESGPCTAY